MEPVPQTYVPNQQILAAELNDLCARGAGSQPADSNNFFFNGAKVTPPGSSEVVWARGITGSFVDVGHFVVVDGTIDWRDRVLRAEYVVLGNTNATPGNADDYLFDVPFDAVRVGYTGTGGRTAGNATPTTSNPPVPAAGTSWAMQLVTDVWLYAIPGGGDVGKLALFNGTGAQIFVPLLFVRATAKTGKRP